MTPLSVLDLVPVSAGSDKHAGLRNAADLAAAAERFGYARYWVAEHHLNPGVIGVSPAVTIALVGGATSTVRLGSAGVLSGHRTPLATVEEFGLLDAAFPGRIDLGIGRSPARPAPTGDESRGVTAFLASRGRGHAEDQHTPGGLLLPRAYDPSRTAGPERLAHQLDLLQQPGAYAPSYDEQIGQLLALLEGDYVSAQGLPAHAHPGEGSPLQVWILGSTGGDSAEVAGRRGLPFVASYHHSPSTVLDAVTSYRRAAEAAGRAPTVAVSADVVVGETDEHAAELASGYAPWVWSIRTGRGAMPYPDPAAAAATMREWTDDDRALVDDRVRTQLVGSPATVAERLRLLRDETGADELVVTTITHRHEDRVRSYELLAQEWLDG